jgi:hypothetical protein
VCAVHCQAAAQESSHFNQQVAWRLKRVAAMLQERGKWIFMPGKKAAIGSQLQYFALKVQADRPRP